MKATLDNRGHVSRIWSDELDRSLAIAHNPFTVNRTPVSGAPLWYRNRRHCFMSDSGNFDIFRARTLIEVLRNFQKAYGGAEKRFGDKHRMSYNNHVYNTKTTALFVCISISWNMTNSYQR